MKGKLIVIEGTDGSGKATQLELLVKRLKEKGVKCKTFDFPQYEKFFGKMVAQYLNGEFGSIDKVNPKFASLLYALDRLQSADEIRNALNEGFIVLCNRYSISNQAHQTSKFPKEKRAEFLGWLKRLEYEELGIPKEDFVFFLDVPQELSFKLIEEKQKREYTEKKRDLHESDFNYLKNTRDMYLELARQKHWFVINCAKQGNLLSKEEISVIVWEKIEKLL